MRKLAVAIVLPAPSILAASDDAAIRSTFIKPWVEALRSRDQARVENFLHPAVRACINPGTREFFDYAVEHEAHSDVSGPYRVIKIEQMRQAAPTFLPAEDVQYPVQPTYEVNIEFGDQRASEIDAVEVKNPEAISLPESKIEYCVSSQPAFVSRTV